MEDNEFLANFLRNLTQPVHSSTEKEWPELAAAWAGREIEKPQETAMTNKVRQMNKFEQWMNPGAYGITYPWNTIALNKERIKHGVYPLDDVLVHELAHVKQNANPIKNWLQQVMYSGDYMDDPNEIEAFNEMFNRQVRRADIHLPRE